jgi:hypothetical protein
MRSTLLREKALARAAAGRGQAGRHMGALMLLRKLIPQPGNGADTGTTDGLVAMLDGDAATIAQSEYGQTALADATLGSVDIVKAELKPSDQVTQTTQGRLGLGDNPTTNALLDWEALRTGDGNIHNDLLL